MSIGWRTSDPMTRSESIRKSRQSTIFRQLSVTFSGTKRHTLPSPVPVLAPECSLLTFHPATVPPLPRHAPTSYRIAARRPAAAIPKPAPMYSLCAPAVELADLGVDEAPPAVGAAVVPFEGVEVEVELEPPALGLQDAELGTLTP